MRILHEINFTSGLGADRWIVGGYRDAFVDLGHEFEYWTYADDLEELLDRYKPDMLMMGTGRLNYRTLSVLEEARKKGTKVFVWTDSRFEENLELFDIMKNREAADAYYGETEPEWMKTFTEKTGKSYTTIPNAANKKYHFPTAPVEKYRADIAFLGANLPLKKEAFTRLLIPLKKKYRVRIYGPGWTIKDNLMRGMAVLARKAGLKGLNDAISKKRLTVPVEEENQLYSSAKMSLNIHEIRSGATKNHMILNERTFKIPACGGVEICDNVPPLRKYFAEDEMIMAENDDDWFKKIDHYIAHDAEREAMRKKGSARALKDHLYHNRVALLLDLVARVSVRKAI